MLAKIYKCTRLRQIDLYIAALRLPGTTSRECLQADGPFLGSNMSGKHVLPWATQWNPPLNSLYNNISLAIATTLFCNINVIQATARHSAFHTVNRNLQKTIQIVCTFSSTDFFGILHAFLPKLVATLLKGKVPHSLFICSLGASFHSAFVLPLNFNRLLGMSSGSFTQQLHFSQRLVSHSCILSDMHVYPTTKKVKAVGHC